MFDWMAWTLPVAVFFTCIVLMLVGMAVWELKSPTTMRKGFLPLETTRGDRLFIGLLSAAYVNLIFVGVSGKPSENVRDCGFPALLPLCQSRPRRPRPAVCRSATSKTGASWPARARRMSSVLVESIWGSTSTVKPGRWGATASQMASAGH